MAYVANRGDIVHLDFDPSSGQEIKGPHYGLVLSGKLFSQQGLAMICPISQGAAAAARTYGMVVSLMGTGADTAWSRALPPAQGAGLESKKRTTERGSAPTGYR